MPTGYTREQIHQFEILVGTNLPPEQSAEQLKDAPIAADSVVAATDRDLLVDLTFAHGITQAYFLNSVVASELVAGLMGAAEEQHWAIAELSDMTAQTSRTPTEKDLWDAFKVLSLRVDSTSDGALLSFSSGRTISQFFMPKKIAWDLMAAIQATAGRAGWWDHALNLIPLDQ